MISLTTTDGRSVELTSVPNPAPEPCLACGEERDVMRVVVSQARERPMSICGQCLCAALAVHLHVKAAEDD